MKKRRMQLETDNIQDDDEDDPKEAMVMPASTNSRVLESEKGRDGIQRQSSNIGRIKKGITFAQEVPSERNCILR